MLSVCSVTAFIVALCCFMSLVQRKSCCKSCASSCFEDGGRVLGGWLGQVSWYMFSGEDKSQSLGVPLPVLLPRGLYSWYCCTGRKFAADTAQWFHRLFSAVWVCFILRPVRWFSSFKCSFSLMRTPPSFSLTAHALGGLLRQQPRSG